jgi:hypothetical protein
MRLAKLFLLGSFLIGFCLTSRATDESYDDWLFIRELVITEVETPIGSLKIERWVSSITPDRPEHEVSDLESLSVLARNQIEISPRGARIFDIFSSIDAPIERNEIIEIYNPNDSSWYQIYEGFMPREFTIETEVTPLLIRFRLNRIFVEPLSGD